MPIVKTKHNHRADTGRETHREIQRPSNIGIKSIDVCLSRQLFCRSVPRRSRTPPTTCRSCSIAHNPGENLGISAEDTPIVIRAPLLFSRPYTILLSHFRQFTLQSHRTLRNQLHSSRQISAADCLHTCDHPYATKHCRIVRRDPAFRARRIRFTTPVFVDTTKTTAATSYIAAAATRLPIGFMECFPEHLH